MQNEQKHIKQNFTFQLHQIFDKFNRCNYISDNFIYSDELHYLIEFYNKNCKIINDKEQDKKFTNIMDCICVYYDWQFGSLRANYKSRLYLKLWLKKLIINIW